MGADPAQRDSSMLRPLFLGLEMAAVPTAASAEVIYGLTNLQQLVTFDSNARVVTSTVSLAGFSIAGELALSIDVRPATGDSTP